MLKHQVISVTDLRVKTKQSLGSLDSGPKYIFSNNKPVAVLMDIDEYELLLKPEFEELTHDEVTEELKLMANEALNTPKSELINI